MTIALIMIRVLLKTEVLFLFITLSIRLDANLYILREMAKVGRSFWMKLAVSIDTRFIA